MQDDVAEEVVMSSLILEIDSVLSGDRLCGVEPAAKRDALLPLCPLPADTEFASLTPRAGAACGGTVVLDPGEDRKGAAVLDAIGPS